MSVPIHEYFINLQQAINDPDRFEDIINISSQILELSSSDKEARQCRAIAYLQDGQFEEALKDIEKLDHFEFEKSYCYYSLGRYQDALNQLSKLPADTLKEPKFVHLRGQIFFQQNRSEECYEIFSKIPGETEDELINISASYAISKTPEKVKILHGEENSFELLLNKIIGLMESGNKVEASQLIKSSLTRETSITLFQILNILYAISISEENVEEAVKILDEICENPKTKNYVKSLAASNYVALALNSNSQEVKKKLRYFDLSEKLRPSEVNPFFIDLFTGYIKVGQSHKASKLIEVAKTLKGVDNFVLEAFERIINPNFQSTFQYAPLFEAQQYISQGEFIKAAQVLSKSKLSNSARTIATICELYNAGNKVENAISFLKSIKNQSPDFISFAVKFALKVEDYKTAQSFSETLVKITKNSPSSISLQALAYSYTDVEMAERYLQRVKYKTFTDAEIDELENTFLQQTEKIDETELQAGFGLIGKIEKKKKKEIGKISPEKLKLRKAKKKKRRRLQLPKNYDPKRIPNPERWMKKKLRLGSRKSKKSNPPPKAAIVGKPIETTVKQPQPPPQKKKGKKKGGKNW